VRRAATTLAAVGLTCALAHACASRAPEPAPPGASNASAGGDWSQFEGGHTRIDPKNARVVPETPIEITNVPYVRGVRLSWSTDDAVPSYDPANETLKLPAETKQAVLAVAVAALPDDADLRVDWYFGDERVFADSLQSRDDGDHYFALVKREGRRLLPLPKGRYHAEVLDGTKLIKTVRFEVAG
jgi:hypothetical protein